MVQDNDGLKYVLKVLERAVSLGDAEGASFLRHVIVGFFLNFLVGQNTLQQEVIIIISIIAIPLVFEVLTI